MLKYHPKQIWQETRLHWINLIYFCHFGPYFVTLLTTLAQGHFYIVYKSSCHFLMVTGPVGHNQQGAGAPNQALPPPISWEYMREDPKFSPLKTSANPTCPSSLVTPLHMSVILQLWGSIYVLVHLHRRQHDWKLQCCKLQAFSQCKFVFNSQCIKVFKLHTLLAVSYHQPFLYVILLFLGRTI